MGIHHASHGCRALGTLRLRQTTTWPSAELEARSLTPFACRTRFETATSLVVPTPRSRRNSSSDLLPAGSRPVARDQVVAAVAVRRAAGRGRAGQDVGAGVTVTDVEVELAWPAGRRSKATKRPSPEIEGRWLLRSACLPPELTLTRSVVPPANAARVVVASGVAVIRTRIPCFACILHPR